MAYRIDIYENDIHKDTIHLIDGDSAVIETPLKILSGKYASLIWKIKKLEKRNQVLEEMLENALSKVTLESFTDDELSDEIRHRMHRIHSGQI
jgi:hypothetical protein